MKPSCASPPPRVVTSSDLEAQLLATVAQSTRASAAALLAWVSRPPRGVPPRVAREQCIGSPRRRYRIALLRQERASDVRGEVQHAAPSAVLAHSLAPLGHLPSSAPLRGAPSSVSPKQSLGAAALRVSYAQISRANYLGGCALALLRWSGDLRARLRRGARSPEHPLLRRRRSRCVAAPSDRPLCRLARALDTGAPLHQLLALAGFARREQRRRRSSSRSLGSGAGTINSSAPMNGFTSADEIAER